MSLVSFSDNFGQISLNQIINYTGSIFNNLNNTMQTKQDAMKKKRYTLIKINLVFI